MSEEIKDISDEWVKFAENDMETAIYCFQGKKYLWTLFMCQQALEKALKAIYNKNTKKIPPKKHDLISIANATGLIEECSEETKDLFRKLSRYYIKTRYPETIKELEIMLTAKIVEEMLTQTKECYQWLKNLLH